MNATRDAFNARNTTALNQTLQQSPQDILAILKSLIDSGTISGEFVANYTVVEGFEKGMSKFTSSLGNVALVDCHSFGRKLAPNLYKLHYDLT